MKHSLFPLLLDLVTFVLCLAVGYGATKAAVAFGEAVGHTWGEQLAVSFVTGLLFIGAWLWVLRMYWRDAPKGGDSTTS